jgi:ribonuclease HI
MGNNLPQYVYMFRSSKLFMYFGYCDGGSRSNTHAACAWMITDEEGKILHSNGTYLGAASNNTSEYFGLILLLTSAYSGGIRDITIVQDSELVSRQMTGQYQVKADHLKPLYATAKHLAGQFDSIKFTTVPREHPQISACDKMCDHIIGLYLDK